LCLVLPSCTHFTDPGIISGVCEYNCNKCHLILCKCNITVCKVWRALRQGHTILTSREFMWCYACSWDVRGDLTLNSMVQIHTSVTLLTSCDLMWSSGWLMRQHASHISVVTHFLWGVTNVSSAFIGIKFMTVFVMRRDAAWS
jgi:hypothetical protein